MTDTELHAEPIETDGVLRPTHVEVRLDRLSENYSAIAAQVGSAKVMPILKANAYGHGLIPVAKRMERDGAAYLGLAYLEEGLKLRRAGIRTPILVLGGIIGSQVPLFIQNDLTLTASSVDKLRAIQDAAAALGQAAKVHLKIDTGMERIGVHWYSAESLLEASLDCPNVVVEGIFSHLANADGPDLSHARLQLERFHEVHAGSGEGIEIHFAEGDVVEEAARYAESERADLVVLGLSERDHLHKAERLALAAPCPVLAVPTPVTSPSSTAPEAAKEVAL